MRMLTPYWTSRNFPSDLYDEMGRFFDDFNHENHEIYDERKFAPMCEISESDGHYLMSVDLPGMKKEDIKIELSDHVLTISGERKREKAPDKTSKVQRYERSYGSFKRCFTLPATIETGQVQARYEDGVLELYLPKALASKPQQIEIQTGKTSLFDKFTGDKNKEKEQTNVTAADIAP